MSEVKLSSKYQLAIPKKIREAAGLHKEQKLFILQKAGIITLIPETPIGGFRGRFKGINIKNLRDDRDRA